MRKKILKFCKECHRIVRPENTTGYCHIYRYLAEIPKRKLRAYYKKRNKSQAYKDYQKQYRLKKKLSLQNVNNNLNSSIN